MSEADADHHRYRALLRDADDEPKRLALIQLLIDEGARDNLAAQLKRSRSEPPFDRPPLMPPVAMHREVPETAVESGTQQWPGEANIAGAADDASLNSTPLAAPPSTSELAAPALASEPPEPWPDHEATERPPQNVVVPLETATGGPAALIAAEPSRRNDSADRVATLVSGRAAPASAGPVAAMVSPSGASPAAGDVEIASRIQAALAELTRVHRPRGDLEYPGGGEARLSLPAPAPSETAIPEAMRSGVAVRTATHDLIERFVRLLGKRLVPPAAAIPSTPLAPPSLDEEENAIVLQIQAALAKQKRDR